MSCNLLNGGSGGCGVNIIWVVILFWLLFFNTGNCSCGCGGSSNGCGSNGCNYPCGC